MDGRPYEVVGVGKPIGTVLGQTQDNYVYIPIETWMKFYATSTTSLAINVQTRGGDWMSRTQEESQMLMRARRHLNPNDLDNFGILDGGSLVDLFKRITGALAASMVGIVAVFLVIGGVVIMNVMLATVTERTREIGLRKSLGARRSDILLQFLTETAVMSTIGGAIGVALAYVFALVVAANTPVPMHVPISAVIIALARFDRRGRVLWTVSGEQGREPESDRSAAAGNLKRDRRIHANSARRKREDGAGHAAGEQAAVVSHRAGRGHRNHGAHHGCVHPGGLLRGHHRVSGRLTAPNTIWVFKVAPGISTGRMTAEERNRKPLTLRRCA